MKFIRKLKNKYDFRVCYEAGCFGFALYRKLTQSGIDCTVVAPSLIPVDIKKVKTDRLDAFKLARYLGTGLLTPINVPDAELENDRDLIRFRASQVKEVIKIKQQIISFLLRKDIKYPERIVWNHKFENWLSTLEMENHRERMTLHRYLNHYKYQTRFLQELNNEIEELSQTERYEEMATILKGFRGIDTLTAMIIITNIPDFRAFSSPRKLMSYIGLVPGEYSSGDKRIGRGITKTGNNLLRKAFISIGQHYYGRDKIGRNIYLRRQKISSQILSLVQRADRRCFKKYRAMSFDGKHGNVIKTAVAREAVAFVWEAMMHYYGGELKEAI